MPVFEVFRVQVLSNNKSVSSDVYRYVKHKICCSASITKEYANGFIVKSRRGTYIGVTALGVGCPASNSGGIRAGRDRPTILRPCLHVEIPVKHFREQTPRGPRPHRGRHRWCYCTVCCTTDGWKLGCHRDRDRRPSRPEYRMGHRAPNTC